MKDRIQEQAETFASGAMGIMGGGIIGAIKNDLIEFLAEGSTLPAKVFYEQHPILNESLKMNSFLFGLGSGLIIFLISKYNISGQGDAFNMLTDISDGGDDGGDGGDAGD